MKLLALDTATEACSAALWLDGEIIEQFKHAPQQHAHLILPMIDALMSQAGLKPAQLDAIAFGRGPGSFTGLRIAAAVTQGIAFASDLPVLAISSLQTIAQTAIECCQAQRILATIDARMGEIYWAEYLVENDLAILEGNERLSIPQELLLSKGKVYVGVGNGLSVYQDSLREQLKSNLTDTLPDSWPKASAMAKLAVIEYQQGRAVAAEQALPVYLRDDVAKKKIV